MRRVPPDDPPLRPAERTRFFFIGVLLMVGGSLAVLGAAGSALQSRRLLATGERARGVVSRVDERSEMMGTTREHDYTATIAFTVDGRAHTFTRGWIITGTARCGYPCFHVGDSLAVVYPRGRPDRADIATDAEQYGGPAFAALFGALALWVGMMFARGRVRRV